MHFEERHWAPRDLTWQFSKSQDLKVCLIIGNVHRATQQVSKIGFEPSPNVHAVPDDDQSRRENPTNAELNERARQLKALLGRRRREGVQEYRESILRMKKMEDEESGMDGPQRRLNQGVTTSLQEEYDADNHDDKEERRGRDKEMIVDDGEELSPEMATQYRAATARLNYLAQDRADLVYVAKELCRSMSKPTTGAWTRLKRAVRYLAGRRRRGTHYPWQETPTRMDVYVDTDFAGCKTSRRSTSGGTAMWGRHCIKSWSATQTTIALSSAEAELGGLVKGACTSLGLQSVANDLSIPKEIVLHGDSAAAIGICRRKGIGKIRHLAVQDLWVQDQVRQGRFQIVKVQGRHNQADMTTKNLSREDLDRHLSASGFKDRGGRPECAPQLEGSAPQVLGIRLACLRGQDCCDDAQPDPDDQRRSSGELQSFPGRRQNMRRRIRRTSTTTGTIGTYNNDHYRDCDTHDGDSDDDYDDDHDNYHHYAVVKRGAFISNEEVEQLVERVERVDIAPSELVTNLRRIKVVDAKPTSSAARGRLEVDGADAVEMTQKEEEEETCGAINLESYEEGVEKRVSLARFNFKTFPFCAASCRRRVPEQARCEEECRGWEPYSWGNF